MAEFESKLVFSEDEQARKKLVKGLESIEKQQKKVSLAVAKGSVTNKEAAKQFGVLAKDSLVLKKALSPLEKEFKANQKAQLAIEKSSKKAAAAQLKMAKAAKKAADALEEEEKKAASLDGRLKSLSDEFSNVSRRVGESGSIETDIRALGGAAATIPGAAGISQAVGGGAEVFAVIEALPRLKVAAKGLPDILQASAKASGLGGFAGSIQKTIPALGGAGAAAVALAIPLIAVTAAVAVLSFGLKKLDDANQKAAASARSAAEARQTFAETEREFADLSVGEQASERNRLFQERADIARDITRENEQLSQLRQAADDSFLGGRLNFTKAIADEQQAVLEELVGSVGDIDAALSAADEAVSQLSGTELLRAQYSQELQQLESELGQTEQERTRTVSQLESAQSRVVQIEERAVQAREQFAANAARTDEDRTIREGRELEDRKARFVKHQESLVAIEREGNAQIESLRQELTSLPKERQAAVFDIESKGRDKIATLNSDFMQNELKTTRQFTKATERIESDGKRARLRLLEDITGRLEDASRSNNVLAFLQAQRDGQKQLSRQTEDSQVSEKKRVDNFISKQKEAEAAQTKRVTQAIEGIKQEQQKVKESFIERRVAIQDSIDTEKLAIVERTRQAVESYDKEIARQTLSDKRRAEDQALQDARRLESHNERLSQIEAQKVAQQAANFAIQQSIDALATRASDLATRIQNATVPTSSPSPTRSRPSRNIFASRLQAGIAERLEAQRGLRRGVRFADGGIVDKPTLGVFGEVPGVSEALIPFRQSEGLPAALARQGVQGSQPMIFNATLNNSIGDIATLSQLNNGMKATVETLLKDLFAPMIENALAGTAG